MKFKSIYDEVYDAMVWLYWDCDEDEMNRSLKRKFKLPESEFIEKSPYFAGKSFKIFNNKTGQVRYVIFLKKKQVNAFYTIVHEVFHTVCKIFEDRKVDFRYAESEHFAYYQDFWVKKVWRAVSKKTTKEIDYAKTKKGRKKK